MLAHRLRRWANISPALVQRPVFAGILYGFGYYPLQGYEPLQR